jgi:predicted phage terminase large subunit-like protein
VKEARKVWDGDLTAYIRRMAPHYRFAPHHRLMIEYLEAVEAGFITRLIINMPPRHGKSETASKTFPAWYLGRNPDKRVLLTAYSDSLAKEYGKAVRGYISDPFSPYGDVKPQGKSEAGDFMALDGWRGELRAAGVDGQVTGRGGHLVMIDDPHKDQAEADSPTMREKVYNWYKGTLYSRLENEFTDPETGRRRRAAIVLIVTRWHEDDLAGRLLKEAEENPAADQWDVLSLSAIAEEPTTTYNGRPVGPDPLGREPGDALWEDKYGRDDLELIRVNTPSRFWSAQYQQRPSKAGGQTFSDLWFNNRYRPEVIAPYLEMIQVVDSAFKTGVENDFSVIATWGRTRTHYDLLDIWRRKVKYPELITALKDNYERWRYYGLRAMYIEDKASGQSAIQSLQAESDLNVIPWDKEGNKIMAAESITPYFAANRVRIPSVAEWVAEWIKEHIQFPTGAHDDQVDTTSMALAILGGPIIPAGRRDTLQGFGQPGNRVDAPVDQEEGVGSFGRYYGHQG